MTPTLNIKRSNKEELLPKMTYDSGKKEKNEKKVKPLNINVDLK